MSENILEKIIKKKIEKIDILKKSTNLNSLNEIINKKHADEALTIINKTFKIHNNFLNEINYFANVVISLSIVSNSLFDLSTYLDSG